MLAHSNNPNPPKTIPNTLTHHHHPSRPQLKLKTTQPLTTPFGYANPHPWSSRRRCPRRATESSVSSHSAPQPGIVDSTHPWPRRHAAHTSCWAAAMGILGTKANGREVGARLLDQLLARVRWPRIGTPERRMAADRAMLQVRSANCSCAETSLPIPVCLVRSNKTIHLLQASVPRVEGEPDVPRMKAEPGPAAVTFGRRDRRVRRPLLLVATSWCRSL